MSNILLEVWMTGPLHKQLSSVLLTTGWAPKTAETYFRATMLEELTEMLQVQLLLWA